MHVIEFTVEGRPAPKGSYSPMSRKSLRTGRTVTFLRPMSKYEHPWRKTIVKQIKKEHIIDDYGTLEVPLLVCLEFRLKRPKSVSILQRLFPIVKPDIDKITRATFDALTDSGLIKDDSYITQMMVKKRYDDHEPEGVTIMLMEDKR